MAQRTAKEINDELRDKFPIGCRVNFYRFGCYFDWPTGRVIGYRHYWNGVKTLVVEMEADSPPLRWEGETSYAWRAGDEYHLTGGDQAYMTRLPEPQKELAL